VLAALQRIDAAAAEAGYPRGRYVFVETRAPGEPDLEVEFTFESYADMERLERAMRERVARFLRDGGPGASGQEHLLEPSATKHLLLVEEGARAVSPAQPSAQSQPAGGPAASRGVSAARPAAAQRAAGPGPEPAAVVPREPSFDDDDDEEFEEPPEPEVPPPPAPPPGMSDDEFRRDQLNRARSALQNAERAAGHTPRRPQRGA
jgi:hypothetical protein